MTVEELTFTADGYGGQTETYSVLGRYYVAMVPMQIRDEFDFEASMPKVRHKVTTRWVEELKDVATIQKYRFTIDGRYWKPLAVRNLDNTRKMYGHQYLEITMEDNGQING